MSEQSLMERVRRLHVHKRNGYGPGDCHCEECQDTMDALRVADARGPVNACKACKTWMGQRELDGASVSEQELRAENRLMHDKLERLIVFDGGAELQPWVNAHKLHRDEPYIGCPFCHDQFVLRSAAEAREEALIGLAATGDLLDRDGNLICLGEACPLRDDEPHPTHQRRKLTNGRYWFHAALSSEPGDGNGCEVAPPLIQKACERCEGRGEVPDRLVSTTQIGATPCPRCSGTGQEPEGA